MAAEAEASLMQGKGHEEELLEVLATEMRESLAQELRERGEKACEEVDCVVRSALRQLTPALRALPAREALRMHLDGQAAGTRAFAGGGAAPQPAAAAGGASEEARGALAACSGYLRVPANGDPRPSSAFVDTELTWEDVLAKKEQDLRRADQLTEEIQQMKADLELLPPEKRRVMMKTLQSKTEELCSARGMATATAAHTGGA